MRHIGLLVWFLVAAPVGCGSSDSDEAGSSSAFRPATSADVNAMLKAWCDWDVRCTKNFPLEYCDERRASYSKPALFAAGPMADLATCFATLSCDSYEDSCVVPVGRAVAASTPSRATFLASCSKRDDECTGEGELSLLTCHWMTLVADSALPQVEACVAKPCGESMSCLYALSK